MTADQRAVARILTALDEAFEANSLHDTVAVWRCLTTIKLEADTLAQIAPSADDTIPLLDGLRGVDDGGAL